MKSKKIAALLSIILMFGLVLSACSSKDEAKGNDGAKPPVTIKFNARAADFSKEDMAPVIAKFEQLNPGIKVDYPAMTEATTDDSMKKIDLLAASGDQLDVFLIADERNYSQRAANGMLEQLNKYMDKDKLKYDEEYKTNTQINGTYYALPGTFSQWFVLINKNHLDEAGLPVPTIDWTWDDYMEYAKKMTKGEGASKRYGTYFHTWPDFVLLALWNQKEKNDIVLPDGTINIDHPGVRKSLDIRYKTEAIDKSAVPYADVISQKLSYRPLYFNQKASMIVMGSWMIGEAGGTDQFAANHKTVFAPIPKNNKSDKGGVAMSSSNYLVVSSTSKHKEEAYKFVRFLSTDGFMMMQKYTTSWKKEDTGKMIDALVSRSKNPAMVDKESLLYVLKNTTPTTLSASVPYMGEVYKAYQDEVEKLLLGQQDIDKTLASSKEKIKKIVDANKK